MGHGFWITHLILFDIFHCEIEPHAESGVASIWSNEQIILKLCNVVYSSQVTWNSNIMMRKLVNNASLSKENVT
jgi:hypothetical protein